MRQGTTALLAIMMVFTSLSTGTVAPVQSISPPPTLFVADDGNDTLNRTNTFPFDILFDDYHEYYEVVSELQKFANDYPEIVEFYTLTDLIPAG
ncbi:MAG: hypothetical protein VYC68_02465, partial [Candidatus Thermoplasmatota archaeon]|nr:hypothetical protein [Candidatus Thermoplasmatota archaeon]